MRILFASARLPFPLDTGAKIRTFHLLSAAARKHEVVLVAPVYTEHEAVRALAERLPNVTLDVIEVPAPTRSVASLVIAAARNIFDPLPLTWMRYQWPTLR